MPRVAPLGVAPGAVRVRTFHALGREILRDAGVAVEPLADRAAMLAEVAPWADEAGSAAARHRHLAAQGRARRHGRRGRRPTRSRDRSPGRSSRTRRAVAASGGLDFDDLHPAGDRPPRGRPGAARALARRGAASSSSTRSRTSTGAAPARAAAGGARRTDLPRRRRRPVDLWLAAGRRAPDPRPRDAPARAAAGRPRGQLPLSRGRSSSARSGSSSTTASGSRRRSGRARPRPGGWSSRRTPSDETVRLERAVRSLARRRLDAGGPGPHEPRAAARGRRRAAARPAVPGAADRAARSSRRIVDGLLERGCDAPRSTQPLLVDARAASGRDARRDDRDGRAARSPTALARLGGRAPRPRRAFAPPIAETRARLADLRRDDAPLTLATAHAHQGPRVRPRHRRRDGDRPVPERPSRRRGRGSGARLRGGTAARRTSRGPARAAR